MKYHVALGATLLLSLNLCAQWTQTNAPAGAGSLFNVHFPTVSTGYLAADNGDIFRTTNAGQSWTQVYNEGTVTGFDSYYFNDILFTNAQTGFAVGIDYWTSDFLILRTTNGGASWTPYNYEQGLQIGWCHAVDFPSAQDGFVVGDFGLVFKTVNGGGTWSVLQSPVFNPLRDVDFVNAQTGYLISSEKELLKTSDGGANWQIINLTEDFFKIQFLDAQTGYGTSVNGLFKTTNGGAIWQKVDAGFAFGPQDFQFLNATVAHAIWNGSFYKTTDGGLNWYVQELNLNLPGQDDLGGLYDLFMVDDANGWAAGYQNVGGVVSAMVVKTTNGGGLGVDLDLSATYLPCPGLNPLTATATIVGGPATFQWFIDDLPTGSSAASQVFTGPWESGSHKIKVQVTNGTNSVVQDRDIFVDYVAGDNPAWQFNVFQLPCIGDRVILHPNFTSQDLLQLTLNGVVVDGPRAMTGNTQDNLQTPPLASDTSIFVIEIITPCGPQPIREIVIPARPLPDQTLPVFSDQPLLRCTTGNLAEIKVGNTDPFHVYRLYQNNTIIGSWPTNGTGGEVILYAANFDSTTVFKVATTNEFGCTAFLNDSLTVQVERPSARFGINGANLPFGTPVLVRFEGQEAALFNWNFGAGATPATFSGITPPPVQYAAGTESTDVRLIVAGSLGCRDTVQRPLGFFDPAVLSDFWAQEMDLAQQQQALILGQNMAVDGQGNIYIDGSTEYVLSDADEVGSALATRAGAPGYLREETAGILKYSPQGVLLWYLDVEGFNYGFRDFEVTQNDHLLLPITLGNDGYVPSTDQKRIPLRRLRGTAVTNYDPQGRIHWAAFTRGCGMFGGAYVSDIATDPAGNIYLLGDAQGNFGSECVEFISAGDSLADFNIVAAGFVAKMNSQGQFLWAKALDDMVYGFALRVDAQGNIYLCGEGLTAVLKLDPNGDLLWKCNNISTGFSQMNIRNFDIDPDGNAYLGGFFRGEVEFPGLPKLDAGLPSHPTDYDLFVLKVSPQGVPLWLKGGFTQDWTENTAVQYRDGSVYLYGTFGQGLFQMDTFNVTGRAYRNVLLLQISAATGAYESHFLLDEPDPDDPSPWGSFYACQGRSFQVDSEKRIHILGRIGYEATFGNTTLDTRGWLFLAKMPPLTVSNRPDLPAQDWSAVLSPNPSAGETRLQITGETPEEVHIRVRDAMGRLVWKSSDVQLQAGENTILLRDGLPAGTYRVEIAGDDGGRQVLHWVIVL